jgi:hypothetical protein
LQLGCRVVGVLRPPADGGDEVEQGDRLDQAGQAIDVSRIIHRHQDLIPSSNPVTSVDVATVCRGLWSGLQRQWITK